MIPLRVIGRRKYAAYATYLLIAVNVLVFIWELYVNSQGPQALPAALATFGLNVCRVGVDPLPNLLLDSVRSMFLHGSLLHLAGNMLFLWVFGRRVEEYFGRVAYLSVYLVVGLLATGAHILLAAPSCSLNDQSILIGASGAIAGVMGAFLVLYPGARIDTMIGFIRPFFWRAQVPAFFFLFYWVVMDLLQGIGWITSAGVAHWAHVGGFVAGFVVAFAAVIFKPAPRPDPFEYLDD